MKKKIISVVGARPNFIKIAPIHLELLKYSKVNHVICHTGQHYDDNMSKVFFDELKIPEPHYFLGVGSASHAFQTGRIMIEFEKVVLREKPDMIIVVGDVNSTVACSLVAKKIGVKVSHIESGLRSNDRTMPEEINRIVTDSISDLLFVTEKSGLANLLKEGIPKERIHFVGNVMIDSLVMMQPFLNKDKLIDRYNINKNNYIIITLHRPSNVDVKGNLIKIISYLNAISQKVPIIFPIHPRTKINLIKFKLENKLEKNIILIEPLSYIEFLSLVKSARLVITDSGGIQEETTYLGVQCITLRDNTERPITVTDGTNHLVGTNLNKIKNITIKILNGKKKYGKIPPLWDGKSAKRIVKIIMKDLQS